MMAYKLSLEECGEMVGEVNRECDKLKSLLVELMLDYQPTSEKCTCMGIDNNCSWHRAYETVKLEYRNEFEKRRI